MTESPLSELSDAVVDPESFLPALDPDEQSEIVALCNSRLHDHTTPHDAFGLVLVLLGIRPACIVSVTHDAISTAKAETMAQDHEAVITWDLAGQLFDAYEIPYFLTTHYAKGQPSDPAQVYLNYHVSFDETRLETYAEAHAAAETLPMGLSPKEEEALGQFLDYPEPAVSAFCTRDNLVEGHLMETIIDDELEEAFGSLLDVYDTLDVDPREFTMLLLPYVVPASVPECLDRIVGDVARFLVGGLAALEAYDVTLLDQVIADYCKRFDIED